MTEKAERTIEKKWFKQTVNFGLMAVLSLVFFFFNSSPVEAGNQQITFQGKLTNASGNSVSNGTYYIKATIYDAASGGSCQYTASSTCASVTSTPVTVTNGIFSINFGDSSASLAAISPTLFNSSALYLGITVCSGAGAGCDSEMTPRKRITAAPYAFNADYLSGLATSTIGGQSSYVPVTDSSGNLKISNSVFIATTTAGQFGVGTTTVPSGVKSYVEGTTASDKLLVLRGNSSQSGNLQEWQNSAGTALVSIDSSGNVSTSGTLNILQDASSNTDPILQLINYDGANTDKTLSFVLPGGSTSGNIQGLSAANRISIKAGSGNSLVIGAGQSTADALAFSLNNVPVLVFDGVNDRAIFKSFDAVLGTGSTTSTLTENSLILGQTSALGVGKFYVDSSGNVSATGSLKTFGNVTSTGHIYPATGNTVDLGALNTAFRDVFASSSFNVGSGANSSTFKGNYLAMTDGTSSTVFNASSLTLGSGIGYNSGMFSINSVGNTSVSGTLSTFGDVTLGDSVADVINIVGILRTINISDNTATTSISNTNMTIGKAAGYNQGVFNVSDLGVVNASGTITTASAIVSAGLTSSGGVVISSANGISNQGNSTLGNSDDAGGDWTQIYGSLAMGIAPTGNAQIYLKASSTTAIPLLIQDNSGNIIGKFASSSVDAIQSGLQQVAANNYSLLTLGDSNLRAGVLSIRGISSAAPGAIIMYRGATAVGAQLTPGALIVSGDDSTVTTSTFSSLSLTIGQQANYNKGVFYVDSNGNTNVSGTLALRGSSGGVVSSTVGNLRLAADGLSPNNTIDFWNSGTKALSISITPPEPNGAASTTFASFVNDRAGSGAFVFLAQNMSASTTASTTIDRVLAAFQTVDAGTATNKVLITAGGHVAAKGVFMASNGNYGIGDMAEYVNLVVGESVEPGDIIIVDTNGLNQYRKSDSAYAKNVAGVISDTGAFIIGSSGEGRAPLALAGLVKTKVTDENGPIAVGDYLVSASLPGYAMKYDENSGKSAGLVGMALEPLTDGEGKITIMVNKGLVAGTGSGSTVSLTVGENSDGTLSGGENWDLGGKNILNIKSISGANGLWYIDEKGLLMAKEIKADKVQAKKFVVEKENDLKKASVGSATISHNNSSVVVENELINPKVKVFITFRSNPNSFWWISSQVDGKFEVTLSKVADGDLTFDYWIVGIEDAPALELETAPAPIIAPIETSPAAPLEEEVPTITSTSETTVSEVELTPITVASEAESILEAVVPTIESAPVEITPAPVEVINQ